MSAKKATAAAEKPAGFYDPNAARPDAVTVKAPVRPVASKPVAKPTAKTAKAEKKAPRPDARASASKGGGDHVRSALPRFEALQVDPKREDLTADAALAEDRGQLDADIARIRATRKPFGSFTQKLALPARSGYKRHWFSDEPGRIPEAEAGGWAKIKDQEGKPVCRVVGRSREGGALYAYAMEIPKVFWDEDMAVRHKMAASMMEGIRKRPIRAKSGSVDKADVNAFYNPRESQGREVLEITESRPSLKPYDGPSAPG